MKKFFNIMCVVLVSALALSLNSCKDDEPSPVVNLIGSWQMKNNSQAATTTTYLQFREGGAMYTVNVYDDGTDVQSGYWSYNSDEQLTIYGGSVLPVNYTIEKLTAAELTLRAYGFTASYTKVNDFVVNKYLE